ncbi:MAG: hypothetical protein P8Y64_00445 [Gammaproteobacteria bacterium]|jgi:hypothetical protein
MLWFGKQAEAKAAGDSITPAALPVEMDDRIAESKLDALLSELEERGGLEPFLASLQAKHELFLAALPEQEPQQLSRDAVNAVINCVFTARRKLREFLAEIEETALFDALKQLAYSDESLTDRLQQFVEVVPQEQKKQRRAMWDLGAEILHFRRPEAIPLMTRWVWDSSTASGALREFIRLGDSLDSVPLDTRPETFEGGRVWLAEVLNERGFYREVPYLVDLVMAQAYADYVKAMSSGFGMIDAEFGAQQDPLEFLVKLLGVDSRTAGAGAEPGSRPDTLH